MSKGGLYLLLQDVHNEHIRLHLGYVIIFYFFVCVGIITFISEVYNAKTVKFWKSYLGCIGHAHHSPPPDDNNWKPDSHLLNNITLRCFDFLNLFIMIGTRMVERAHIYIYGNWQYWSPKAWSLIPILFFFFFIPCCTFPTLLFQIGNCVMLNMTSAVEWNISLSFR